MKKEDLLVGYISELSDIESQINILLNIRDSRDPSQSLALAGLSLSNLSNKLDRLGVLIVKLIQEYENTTYVDEADNHLKATDCLAGLIGVSLFKTLSKLITSINSDLMVNTSILDKLSSKDGAENKQKLLIDTLLSS